MKRIIGLFLLISFQQATAQEKYLIKLKDKAQNEFSIDNPEAFLSSRAIARREKQNIAITNQDLPVSQNYKNEIAQQGATIIYSSKWLNAVLIEATDEILANVLSLPMVAGIEGIVNVGLESRGRAKGGRTGQKSLENYPLDGGIAQSQLEQLEADKMHEMGFRGKGILIGLLDSGFQNANTMSVFSKLFSENRVLETYNFVNNSKDVYAGHNHGTNVLSCIASDEEDRLVGTAPDASFVLYVTENVASETRLEEVNWLIAAERADSIGVDIIGSSLGYYDFDNDEQDYPYAAMDGNTTLVSRAADWAASKGILLVLSAGNEGNSAYGKITAPADADSVIAVAAVDKNGSLASFSSQGPSSDGQIKPELAARGAGTAIAVPNGNVGYSNGTSFSAPLLSGMAAGIMQAFPNLSAMEIRSIMLKSGTQALNPDNKVGYGIPRFTVLYEQQKLEEIIKGSNKDVIIYPNPANQENILKVIIANSELGNSFNLKIINTLGKEVYTDTFTNRLYQKDINALGIGGGSFIIKVYNDSFSTSERIIIE